MPARSGAFPRVQTSNRDAAIFVASMEDSIRFPIAHLSRVPKGGIRWPDGAKKAGAARTATPVGLEAAPTKSTGFVVSGWLVGAPLPFSGCHPRAFVLGGGGGA